MAEQFCANISTAVRNDIEHIKVACGCDTDLQVLLLVVGLARRASDHLNEKGRIIISDTCHNTQHSFPMFIFKKKQI
jgi:hypothetical protein